MLSIIIWGALSTLSFFLYFALPAGPNGTNYTVLVPGFIALTASVLQATQFRQRRTHQLAVTVPAPAAFDDKLVEKAEKLRHDKLEEQERMLRHQSSRRRAVRR